MSMAIEQVAQQLTDLGVRHRMHDSGRLLVPYGMERYRDEDGDNGLLLVIGLAEDGELLIITAPNAYHVVPGRVEPVLAVCGMVMGRVPLVRYCYRHGEQSLSPAIDVSIEDGVLTAGQLSRCIHTLLGVVDTYHDVVRLAIESGRVDHALVEDPDLCRPSDDLRDLLDLLPADVLLEAADRARARQS